MNKYIQELWNFGVTNNKKQYFDYKITTNDNKEILCHKFALSRNKVFDKIMDYDDPNCCYADFSYDVMIDILSLIYDYNYYIYYSNDRKLYVLYEPLESMANIIIDSDERVYTNYDERVSILTKKEHRTIQHIIKLYLATDFYGMDFCDKITSLFYDIDEDQYIELLEYSECDNISKFLKTYQKRNKFSYDLIVKISEKVTFLGGTVTMVYDDLDIKYIDELNKIAVKLDFMIDVKKIEDRLDSFMDNPEIFIFVLEVNKKSNFNPINFDQNVEINNFNDLLLLKKYIEIPKVSILINNFVASYVFTFNDICQVCEILENKRIIFQYNGENYENLNNITTKYNIKLAVGNTPQINLLKIKNLYKLIGFATPFFYKKEVLKFNNNMAKIKNTLDCSSVEKIIIKTSVIDDFAFLDNYPSLIELEIYDSTINNNNIDLFKKNLKRIIIDEHQIKTNNDKIYLDLC